MTIQSINPELLARIEASLDTIRPHLQMDGGDLEIVGMTADNILKVRLLGACEACPMSFMTMKAGVEHSVKMAVPEVQGVETV